MPDLGGVRRREPVSVIEAPSAEVGSTEKEKTDPVVRNLWSKNLIDPVGVGLETSGYRPAKLADLRKALANGVYGCPRPKAAEVDAVVEHLETFLGRGGKLSRSPWTESYMFQEELID